MLIHNSFPDFLLFLYVHMSQVDNQYDPRELKLIETKMSNLFGEDTDFEKKLYNTIREYKAFDRAKLDTLFKASFDHFKKEGSLKQNQLYADLQDITTADGEVKPHETVALQSLKKLIEFSLDHKS